MDDALPSLPDPVYYGHASWLVGNIPLFNADQMRDYARAALRASTPASVAVARLSVQELLRIYDEQNGDWCAIAREVEDRALRSSTRKSADEGQADQAVASQAEEVATDAARYRWLSKTLMTAVGGGVEVNDQRLVYEQPEPGEAVRVYWYPDTPVGFYASKADTLDAAIDAAMVHHSRDSL